MHGGHGKSETCTQGVCHAGAQTIQAYRKGAARRGLASLAALSLRESPEQADSNAMGTAHQGAP